MSKHDGGIQHSAGRRRAAARFSRRRRRNILGVSCGNRHVLYRLPLHVPCSPTSKSKYCAATSKNLHSLGKVRLVVRLPDDDIRAESSWRWRSHASEYGAIWEDGVPPGDSVLKDNIGQELFFFFFGRCIQDMRQASNLYRTRLLPGDIPSAAQV